MNSALPQPAITEYQRTFTSSDLSSNLLYVTHGLQQRLVNVTIMDSNNKFIPIDDNAVVYADNSLTIDFSGQTISGSWSILCSTGGGGCSNGGSGGEWTLVERWEPTSAAPSADNGLLHTFSGLNGDMDRRYKIVAYTVTGNSSVDGGLRVCLNDDTTPGHYVESSL
jgi:hypothetical protein